VVLLLDAARLRRCGIALGIAVWTGSATVSRAFHEPSGPASPTQQPARRPVRWRR